MNNAIIDIQPENDYQAIFDKLDELYKQNILSFETCEARVERSFDNAPE